MAGAVTLFYLTTRPAELVASLQAHGLPARLTFVIHNAVAMIPRLAERAGEVTEAQRARGLDSEGSLLGRAAGHGRAWPDRRSRGAIAEAETRTLALEMRGFTRPGRHTLLWVPADSGLQRAARWAMRSPWRCWCCCAWPAGTRLVNRAAAARVSDPVLSLDGVSYRYPGRLATACTTSRWSCPEGSITGLLGAAGVGPLDALPGARRPGAARHRRHAAGHRCSSTARMCATGPCTASASRVVLGVGSRPGSSPWWPSTVYEEVAFGPANLGLPRGEVMARTEEALEQLAIDDLASRDPARLSGGQQQLVALAGLLAMRARHLVLDEPLAHLDAHGRELVTGGARAAAAGGRRRARATQHERCRGSQLQRLCCSWPVGASCAGASGEVLADPATLGAGHRGAGRQRLAACGDDRHGRGWRGAACRASPRTERYAAPEAR